MEPDFKEACKATEPYIKTLLGKFKDDLYSGVFMGNEADFIKAKHKVELIDLILQTVTNETLEGDK